MTRLGARVVDRYVRGATTDEAQTFAGILDSYRAALRDNSAKLVGRATIDGRPVIWIELAGKSLPDVRDTRQHTFAEQVAVDAKTYAPVAMREGTSAKSG